MVYLIVDEGLELGGCLAQLFWDEIDVCGPWKLHLVQSSQNLRRLVADNAFGLLVDEEGSSASATIARLCLVIHLPAISVTWLQDLCKNVRTDFPRQSMDVIARQRRQERYAITVFGGS